MKNTPIGYYNGAKDNVGTTITIEEALNTIKSDELSNQVYTIAHTLDDKKRSALKAKLPACTFSGTFAPKRNAQNLSSYSSLIVLDFDKLNSDALSKLKKEARAQPFVVAAFTSPSGNGLKVLCHVAGGPEFHLDNFLALQKHFSDLTGHTADASGKDTSRLCFLSWDLGAYINYEAETFAPIFTQPEAQTAPQQDFAVNFQEIRTYTDRKQTYAEGTRNAYINLFVMNCKARGVDEAEAKQYCLNAFSDYVAEHSETDVKNICASVYANNTLPFNTWKKHTPNASAKAKPGANRSTPAPGPASDYNETILFWYETQKVDKETGEIKVEHKFDHDGLTFFLANNGFRKLRLGEKGFQFVRLTGTGLIEAVEPEDINHFIMAYLHKDVFANENGTYDLDSIKDDLHEVRKMYKRGVNSYTKIAIYTSLPELKPTFLKDNETTCYLYFENGYVEITGTEKKIISYDNLKANIWSKQRKQHSISILANDEIEKSVVYRFIRLAIIGSDEGDEKDLQRLISTLTTIGYCIDTYKDPTNTKAPVFQDRKINLSGTEANGGSGKTLTAHIIGKIVNTCLLDGKSFSFEAAYPYDLFRADHKLIVYNDVNRRFPFDTLFHKITEDFSFDKRYVDAVVIPHEDAPKHLVITNYSLTGEGGSFRRRQQIIEFTDYFNDERTPKDVFGHRFFIDWDVEEWNRFYNFLIHCVHLYKQKGLVAFPAENVKYNKLLAEAGEDFVLWMDELFIGFPEQQIQPVRNLEANPKDELFEAMKTQVKRWAKLENSNKFTTWVKMWADMRGYFVDVKKSGRNYYWTFSKK